MIKLNIIVLTAPCNTFTYEVRALKFKQDPLNIWFGEHDSNDTLMELKDDIAKDDGISEKDAGEESEDTLNPQKRNMSVNEDQSSEYTPSHPRYIYVYYTTSDETTYTSAQLIDLPNFISSTGGNLGLFLGFSFMGIHFPIYELSLIHN